MATKLTQRGIKSATYLGGWDVRWDSAVPGLGLRIYPSGKKAFVLSYRAKGRKRLMVLGRYGADLTLDKARTKASKERGKLGDGLDPLEEKRAAGRGKTFGELIEDFMERHVEAQRLKTAKAIRRRLERNIPASWKSRHADAIEGWEIEELHQRIGKTRPYEANRLLENLKTMYRHAPRWKYVKPSALNPTDDIKKFKERKRKRWVKPEELPPLAKAIDAESNIYVRAAIWLYLLTGVRKSELLEAKREEVDWERGQLRLPETKAGDEQIASLSAPALAILQALPRQEKNPYIFPGAKKKHHLVNIDKPWGRIKDRATLAIWTKDKPCGKIIDQLRDRLEREPTVVECVEAAAKAEVELPIGLLDLRLHDLRRTVGSWLAQGGVDLNRIKDALRHAKIETTLIYARLGEDAAKPVMEEHGRRILKAAGKHRPAEVVGLDRTK